MIVRYLPLNDFLHEVGSILWQLTYYCLSVSFNNCFSKPILQMTKADIKATSEFKFVFFYSCALIVESLQLVFFTKGSQERPSYYAHWIALAFLPFCAYALHKVALSNTDCYCRVLCSLCIFRCLWAVSPNRTGTSFQWHDR